MNEGWAQQEKSGDERKGEMITNDSRTNNSIHRRACKRRQDNIKMGN